MLKYDMIWGLARAWWKFFFILADTLKWHISEVDKGGQTLTQNPVCFYYTFWIIVMICFTFWFQQSWQGKYRMIWILLFSAILLDYYQKGFVMPFYPALCNNFYTSCSEDAQLLGGMHLWACKVALHAVNHQRAPYKLKEVFPWLQSSYFCVNVKNLKVSAGWTL